MKDNFKKLLLRCLKGAVVLIIFSPLVLGPFGLSFSEYPKTIYFRTLTEVALILWLILLMADFKYAPRITLLTGAVLAFFAAQVVSSLAGFNFDRSFWGTLEAGRGLIMDLHYTALFLLLAGVFRTKQDWLFLLRIFVFVSFISTLAGFLQFAGVEEFYSADPFAGRISGTLSNPVYFGSFLVISIFIGLYLVVAEQRIGSRVIFGMLTLLNVIALVFTQTRGAFSGLVFGLFVAALLCLAFLLPHNQKLKINILMAGLACSAALLFLAINQQNLIDNPLFGRLYSVFDVRSINDRLPAWEIALRAWRDRPILGWGPESFGFLYDKYFAARYYKIRPSYDVFYDAHNKILNLAAENGMAGVSLYAAIFMIVFAVLWKKKEKIGMVASFILIGLFAGYFVQDLFAFDTVSTNLAFFLLLGFVNNFIPQHWETGMKWKYADGQGFRRMQIFFKAISILLICIVFASLYFINLKPALASRDFVKGFSLEENNFPQAIAHYEKGIGRNTPYRRELTVFLAWRDISALENGRAKQWRKEIIQNLADLHPFFKDNVGKPDSGYLNMFELFSRANEWIYISTGEKAALAEAEKNSRDAIEFNSQWMQFYYLLGKLALYHGNRTEGEDLFWKGYHLSKEGLWDLAGVYNAMGIAYFRSGNNELAAQNFKKVVNLKYVGMKYVVDKKSYGLDPGAVLSPAKNQLLEMITQADVSLFEGTAWLFLQLGDKDTALEIYGKALEVYPAHETRLKMDLERLMNDVSFSL